MKYIDLHSKYEWNMNFANKGRFLQCLSGKESTKQEKWVQSLGQEDPLEEKNGTPLQYSCLENLMNRGAWRATVHRVAKSWAQLRTKQQPQNI